MALRVEISCKSASTEGSFIHLTTPCHKAVVEESVHLAKPKTVWRHSARKNNYPRLCFDRKPT
jgi:hypothetical protein